MNNETKPHSLYPDNQQKVIAYARLHHAHMSKCFSDLRQGDYDVIKVEKVYDYLKEAFSQDGFVFRDGIRGGDMLG